MITESVIIFGTTGNVVMVLDGELPKDSPVRFKVGASKIELYCGDDVVYSETGLNNYVCQRLRTKEEIGLLEVLDRNRPPVNLTSVAHRVH